MEAVFTIEKKAQVRNAGEAIRLAETLNSTKFSLTWDRFGHEQTAPYEKREGRWGTFTYLKDEWTPVDGNGCMVHQKGVAQ